MIKRVAGPYTGEFGLEVEVITEGQDRSKRIQKIREKREKKEAPGENKSGAMGVQDWPERT